ncbi:Pcmt1-prov protein [Leucosporidium creatinivorum]|uniref:protein-L-isoaspartate(D-aspartate) O-methyltransferase n=1 Tax=Leucosporidium creatinivorum TaxID=106004 RepID=A0A1Y2G3Q9_9BASI|nr:Pcmt1-prov protein [Leucosporidium creatinivorum]
MAWRCGSTSNSGLISNLASAGILSTPRIISAFEAVDRAHFCSNPRGAYEDSPQYIGHGATISAPHMHAHALEALEPFLKPGAKVLDVGSGSGYLLAVLSHVVGPTGFVLGIDHIPALVSNSLTALQRSPSTANALSSSPPSLKVVVGDGRAGATAADLPEGGWDAIHVGAAAPTMPEKLVEQLKSPGRLFIPIGEVHQAIWQVDKDVQGTVTRTTLFGVNYVPLTDASKQLD